MNDQVAIIRAQVVRQVAHWTAAISHLEDLENFAAPSAWEWLERYLGMTQHYIAPTLRKKLLEAVDRLKRQAAVLRAEADAAETVAEIERLRRNVIVFRRRYFQTETILNFYGSAINARTNPRVASLLRACDILAIRSMSHALDQLGKKTPPVLTYIDKGLGASILRAGLRLWDQRTLSSVASIKVVWHNFFRSTSLIHEAGHQLAHIVGWNEELAAAISRHLASEAADVRDAWASWASEIAADAFAFAHAGYAATAGLHDVLSGEETFVFHYRRGDPHPVSYIRVLLGTEMCTRFYGAGPWDDLSRAWTINYSLKNANPEVRELLKRSLPLLPTIVEVSLRTPMRAFGGRTLAALVDPERVKPEALANLERQGGSGLYTSLHFIWTECLRLLALSGFQSITMPERIEEVLKQQERWMLRLGMSVDTPKLISQEVFTA
ncbi:hypothetical protein [Desulfonatronum thioautotrophicum]|uniref:hypothetical protein n=1 Tax=Desulfonatronum thioautotrophicum TaxID=617001 RepID=UPI0005EB7993|nr:hypothetical protein [Desulfonatronum thioautotrophicum]